MTHLDMGADQAALVARKMADPWADDDAWREGAAGFGEFDAPHDLEVDAQPAATDAPEEFAAFGDSGDFGDFGDFEDVHPVADEFTDDPAVWQDPDRPPPLKSLALDPFPPPDLAHQLAALLGAIFPARETHAAVTREPIRQVEGVQQMLYTESSRELYAQLVTPPPRLKPLDWKRSRVRREQLIALGIPVNLDEVDTTRLPPLKIITKEAAAAADARRPARQPTRDEQKLGQPPEFDKERAERLLSYREDQLALVPPAYLTRMQADLVAACSTASARVAYLKQLADARREDHRVKNEQIAGLIAQAQRVAGAAAAGGGGGLFKRGSVRSVGVRSGGNTPRRMDSPGMR